MSINPASPWDGCLLEALKSQALMPYFFSLYPYSSGVPLAPLLRELSNYCQHTGKWKEFLQASLPPQMLPTRLVGSTRCLFSIPAFCSLPWLVAWWLSNKADHTSKSLLLLNLKSLQLKNHVFFHTTCDCCHID